MENESCNLYLEASASGIEVAWFPLSVEPSMAIQFKDTYAIALDPSKISSNAEANTLLAHELGHCKTGSFYNPITAGWMAGGTAPRVSPPPASAGALPMACDGC